MFDCKKCPVHWGSFIKHHGLFVPYIVDIFDCEKYNIHLVSFIKNHGLFVPYIDDIFIFLIRISWLSPPSYIHPFQEYLFHTRSKENTVVKHCRSLNYKQSSNLLCPHRCKRYQNHYQIQLASLRVQNK